MIQRILTQHGYSVLAACDGEHALAVAEKFAGRIDLMLTDTVMPRMGGGELALRLSGARPEMKVLFMSGYPDDELVERGVRAGGSHYLQKPFTPGALEERIRQILDG